MRCQYCGKRLPLFRKLTDGEFCSAAHRSLFHEQQEQLGLQRLLDAQPRGRKRKGDKAPEARQDELGRYLPEVPREKDLSALASAVSNPMLAAPRPIVPVSGLRAARPALPSAEGSEPLSPSDSPATISAPEPAPVALLEAAPTEVPPPALEPEPPQPGLLPVAPPEFRELPVSWRVFDAAPEAGRVRIQWEMIRRWMRCAAPEYEVRELIATRWAELLALPVEVAAKALRVRLRRERLVLAAPAAAMAYPACGAKLASGFKLSRMKGLPALEAPEDAKLYRSSAPPVFRQGIVPALRVALPVSDVEAPKAERQHALAAPEAATGFCETRRAPVSRIRPRIAMTCGTGLALQAEAKGRLEPIARLAALNVEILPREGKPAHATAALPIPATVSAQRPPLGLAGPRPTAQPDSLFHLNVSFQNVDCAPTSQFTARAVDFTLPPMRPRLKVQTVLVGNDTGMRGRSRFSLPSANLSRFWGHMPNDMRWVIMAIPLALGLAWFSFTPRGRELSQPVTMETTQAEAVRTPAAPASEDEGNFLTARWQVLKDSIGRRAAIELGDDFRAGLGSWQGRDGWSDTWDYDAAGFLRPGGLAVFQPSLELSDYRFEFLGAIERRAMSWVYRAQDLDNYQVGRIVILDPGPLPKVIFERYAVIGGKPGPKTQRTLFMTVHTDNMFRVRVDAQGDSLTTLVQGQVVDTFNDSRLRTGGVGFFSAKGEQSRLRWIEVSHQYDTLGRLCALLAPYSISNSHGRVNQ